MLKSKISPSLMCADIFNLRYIIDEFEKNNIEYLHLDVMDGHFVPNYCLGTDYCRRLKAGTKIPFDLHLMVTEPEKTLNAFNFEFSKEDIVSVHYESTDNIEKALELIRERGARAFLTINPDTPVETIRRYLGKFDGLLLMTVYPGFAGQKMVPGSLERITEARKLLDEAGYPEMSIEVDGNVNYEKAPLMKKAGADIFVVGTSSVLGPGDLGENILKMRNLLEEVSE
ncbi:MAG: ribulose-phosphate 3-epimerase [Clostridia bacterium]|nr:ribulose-phosphate 3-epimerase [Clostridia bacterium]